jgi:CheY-like chemotaxis protein
MRPGKRILLVEDDAATRAAMARLLERAGYQVDCAADGRQALDRLDSGEPPAAILLDLSMPVMSGWEFRQRQRRDPSLGRIPVLLLSAGMGLPETAASLGVAGYFPKPIDVEGLLLALHKVAERRAAAHPVQGGG